MRRLKNKCNFWSYKVKKEKMAMGHILRMNPVFKEMIWGGTKLKDIYGYEIPSDHTGECLSLIHILQITKIVNNNIVISEDKNHKEVVLMGKGLGFQKHKGDEIKLRCV